MLFTNPDVYGQFGDAAVRAIEGFLAVASGIGAELFMPGSVYDELRKMKNIEVLAPDFESIVQIRSPARAAR